MNLDIYSRDWNERIVACEIFKLMQLIVGNYILEEHNKNEIFPSDFVDLKNKIITWHSDNENDNVLQLAFDERYVTVAITKEKKSQNNLVRIRTNGSAYGIYHMFFTEFHKNITQIINKNNSYEEQKTPKQKTKKKISLKNIISKK